MIGFGKQPPPPQQQRRPTVDQICADLEVIQFCFITIIYTAHTTKTENHAENTHSTNGCPFKMWRQCRLLHLNDCLMIYGQYQRGHNKSAGRYSSPVAEQSSRCQCRTAKIAPIQLNRRKKRENAQKGEPGRQVVGMCVSCRRLRSRDF